MTVMTRDEARQAHLGSGDVARLLKLSQDTVGRIEKSALDYWSTPGGHRRYRRADVVRYGRDVLGVDIPDEDPEGR